MKRTAEFPVKNYIDENGIEGFLFDLDDTLIKTSEIFSAARARIVELYAAVLPHLQTETIATILARVNIETHKYRSVNPNRWDLLVSQLEKELELETNLTNGSLATQALRIFADIYKQHPEFEKEAQELLQKLREWSMLIGIITHANVEWTWFKLESLGLANFFDHVTIISEDVFFKTATDWQMAADRIQIEPKKAFGAGDNIKGDVQAALDAGFNSVAWVNKKNGWEYTKVGERPSGIFVVEQVSEILTLDESKKVY